MSGWIKLHRAMLEWEWYDDINVKTVFLHLLLTANFEPSKYRGHTVGPGQSIIGFNALSEQTGLSRSQVRTAIDKLKMTGEIALKTTNKFSIVTMTCWSEYQSDSTQNRTQIAIQSPSNRHPIAPSKELNNLKTKEKKVHAYTEDFETWWKSYPHRTDKPEAFKYFKEVCPTEISLEDLLSQTLKYTQKCKSDEISFKGAMRWLKDRRFEDDFDLFNAGKRVVG